jgi:hypothetical protein
VVTTAGRQASAANRIAKLGPAPSTLSEALASPESAHWQAAVDAELARLADVWEPTTIGKGIKPIGSRWVFQRIPTPSGIRYRARVVAKGSDLVTDGGEGEGGEGGAKVAALRFLLAYAQHHGLHITHIRVEDACLAVPCEPVVMAIPSGIKLGGNAVILHKTLYGLKTAYAAELRVVRDALAALAMYPLDAEPCLLVQRCISPGEPVALPIAMTYPGGVVVAGPASIGDEVLDSLVAAGLDAKRGPDDLIYGITAQRIDDILHLSQPQYVARVVRRFRSVFRGVDAPEPTPELRKSLKAFSGSVGWLARTTHLPFSKWAHTLARNAHRSLDGEEWEDAWEDAWYALDQLKDPVEQSLTLVLRPHRDEASQLSASATHGNGRLQVVVFYEDMAIEWFVRDTRGNHDREGHTYRAAQLAAEAVVRWSRVVREIEPLLSVSVLAHVDFEDVRAAEMKRVLDLLRSTGADEADVLPFPDEDEDGHQWCPCCCPVKAGNGE